MIVNDFRNPLTAIQLTLYMLASQSARLTPQQAEEKAQRAIQDVQRLNNLVDDILMIGQMDLVSDEFSPEEVNLTIYLHTLLEQFKAGIDAKMHELVFDGSETSIN